MAETGYSGLAFPLRIGARGGWLMSTTSPTDIPHIKESIRLILSTYVGERVCEPTFGSEVHDVIFDNMDISLVNMLRFKIQEALERWEPRIAVNDIAIHFNQDENNTELFGSVVATIDFTVLRTQTESSVTVVLRREA